MKKQKNHKKYSKDKNVVPFFITNSITANEEQFGNKAPAPPPENAEFSKKCVDENHK